MHLIFHLFLRAIPQKFRKYICYVALFAALIFGLMAINTTLRKENKVESLSELPTQINNLPKDTFYKTKIKSLVKPDFKRVSMYKGKQVNEFISYAQNQNNQSFLLLYQEKYPPIVNKVIAVSISNANFSQRGIK